MFICILRGGLLVVCVWTVARMHEAPGKFALPLEIVDTAIHDSEKEKKGGGRFVTSGNIGDGQANLHLSNSGKTFHHEMRQLHYDLEHCTQFLFFA